MALGLQINSGSGEARDYVKYDARAGRLFQVDRKQDASGSWVQEQIDITQTAQFVADLPEIEVGWINFTEQGPVRVMVKLGNPIPPRPEGVDKNGRAAFKSGFSLQLAMPKDLGGGVREFSSTAACVIEAVNELHDAYLMAPEARVGKLPVVAITNVLPIKSGQSTNYRPVFRIIAWVERPTLLVNGAGTTKPASTPPATGSAKVAAPVAAAPPTAGDFG